MTNLLASIPSFLREARTNLVCGLNHLVATRDRYRYTREWKSDIWWQGNHYLKDRGFPPLWLEASKAVRRAFTFWVYSSSSLFSPVFTPNKTMVLWKGSLRGGLTPSHPFLTHTVTLLGILSSVSGPLFQDSSFSSGLISKYKIPASLVMSVAYRLYIVRPSWMVTFYILWGSICQTLQTDFWRGRVFNHLFLLKGGRFPKWESTCAETCLW